MYRDGFSPVYSQELNIKVIKAEGPLICQRDKLLANAGHVPSFKFPYPDSVSWLFLRGIITARDAAYFSC